MGDVEKYASQKGEQKNMIVKKKGSNKLIIISVLVLALIGTILGGIALHFTVNQRDDLQEQGDKVGNLESLDDAALNYNSVDGFRADGDVEMHSGGVIHNIDLITKSIGPTTFYTEMAAEGETIYIFSDIQNNINYAYVSDGESTLRFEMEEGAGSEDIYNDITESSPSEILKDLDTWEENAEVQVNYLGEENCRDMKCHKYEIVDSTTDTYGSIYILVDTQERLPRIVEYDAQDLDGYFDIYYEDYEFDIPDEYKDIKVDTMIGITQLYSVVGDFVDLFL